MPANMGRDQSNNRTYARSGVTAEGTRLYRASKLDCDVCELKAQCCPNAVARKIPRDLHKDGWNSGEWLGPSPLHRPTH